MLDKKTTDSRFLQCLQGYRVKRILLTMSCTIFALCAIMRKHRNTCAIRMQKGNGDRERLARRACRPAEHIVAKRKIGSAARDTPHYDRHGRAPGHFRQTDALESFNLQFYANP